MSNPDPKDKPEGAPAVGSRGLLAFHIPAELDQAFDAFVTMGIAALDGMSNRADWTLDERAIVEWLEHDNHKSNGQDEARREQK